MKRSILAAAIASSLAQQAIAEVPKNVHELCLSAADYSGCVKINSGDLGDFRPDGNACPKGYAYVGNKTCREVECRYLAYKDPICIACWKSLEVQEQSSYKNEADSGSQCWNDL